MASQPSEVQPAAGYVAPEVTDAVYGDSYFAAHRNPARARPALAQDVDVDVCVVGAGLAGLTVARELARKGWSVVVLEAKRIAWNASGRNTGFVLPGFAQDAQTIVDRVGLEAAREVWGLSLSGAAYVRQAIADGNMQGMEQSDGWLHVSKTDRTNPLRDETELLRNLGSDVEFWPEGLVRSKLKSNGYFQAIHFPTAFSIHPLNYALGLAELAEQAGARIFENTSAVSIDPAGVRKRIVTPGGRVRAAHIVLAGNTHIGKLAPTLSTTLIPVHTFVIVTKPLGPELAEAIDYPGAVSDTDRADNHYRIIGSDRLMWAGRMTVWDAKAGRFGRRLRRDLARRFPQLKNAEVDYTWTGELGMAVHRMPQIGEVSPGVWLASAFAGHGLNTTAMAGELIARAVVENDDRWRQFQPFELVWAGGRTGRIVLQGAYWASRQYEKLAAKHSRARERRRIRMEPILKQRAEKAEERTRLYEERQQREALAREERLRISREQTAARLAEKERLAAERAEAKRIRDEQRAIERAQQAEQKRIRDEQLAVERAEAARIKAEQDAENARIKAEQAAARQAEKERLAAEKAEAKRLEAEQREAEKVAAEAARILAAQVAAEKAAAEAAAAEAARLEAARIAAEQAERDAAAQAEAERIAAEESAAAEAAKLEAEYVAARNAAAEAEAAAAARAEQDRLAAQKEAERPEDAVEAQAQRLVAEEVSQQLQRPEAAEVTDEQPKPEGTEPPEPAPTSDKASVKAKKKRGWLKRS